MRLNTFALNSLLLKNNLTYKQLCKKIKCNSTHEHYCIFSDRELRQIAKILHTTPDYLEGKTILPQAAFFLFGDKHIIPKNLWRVNIFAKSFLVSPFYTKGVFFFW